MSISSERIAVVRKLLERYRDAGRHWMMLKVPDSDDSFADLEELMEIGTDEGWDTQTVSPDPPVGSVILFKLTDPEKKPRKHYPPIEVVGRDSE